MIEILLGRVEFCNARGERGGVFLGVYLVYGREAVQKLWVRLVITGS